IAFFFPPSQHSRALIIIAIHVGRGHLSAIYHVYTLPEIKEGTELQQAALIGDAGTETACKFRVAVTKIHYIHIVDIAIMVYILIHGIAGLKNISRCGVIELHVLDFTGWPDNGLTGSVAGNSGFLVF